VEEVWQQGTTCFQSLLCPETLEIDLHGTHWIAMDLHASFVWLLLVVVVVAHTPGNPACTHSKVVCLEATHPDFLQAEVPALLTMTLGEMGWVAAGEYPLYLREQAREFSTGFNIPFKNCRMRSSINCKNLFRKRNIRCSSYLTLKSCEKDNKMTDLDASVPVKCLRHQQH